MSRKLFDKYLKPIKYNDAFGHNEVWNDEIEKWLSSVPVEHIEKNKGRFGKAGREKQRDNFLAELCASYYLQDKLGWNLKEISPIGSGNHELEYLFRDISAKEWHCEIKNSSWEKEIMDGDGDWDSKVQRTKSPKYIKGDGRSFSFADSYEDQIRKAEKQLMLGNNNLLVILPDTFISPLVNPYIGENILEAVADNSPITAIGILDRRLSSGTTVVEYAWKLVNIKE